MDPIHIITSNSISSQYLIQEIDNNFSEPIYYSDKFSIIIIEKGYGIGYINSQQLVLRAPMVICINQQESFDITKSANLKGKVISFHPNMINENFTFKNLQTFDHSFSTEDIQSILHLSIFYKRYETYMGQVHTSEPVLKHILKLTEYLYTEADIQGGHASIIMNIIIYIERLIQTNLLLSRSIITETSFEVKDVLFYLHNNFKNKITIPQLSRLFHVNRTTLSDRFYEATGETIITYLNKQRINVATIMLRESSLTISEIATQVGFNDTAYFAKLFKKYVHYTPSEYRQRYYSLLQLPTM